MPAEQDIQAITAALAAPFAPQEVHFKPGVVRGRRALALAYVDVRAVEDRLDEVLGMAGWQDEYEALPGGNVLCRLRVRLFGEWLTKSDVGGPGRQPDEGDRIKAACSNALKRAAVKYRVGRYLYRLVPQWCDYDPDGERLLTHPALPPWALPSGADERSAPRGESGRVASCEQDAISEAQCRHLRELLSAKGYSPRRLVERYGVERLRNLTAAQYRHAAGSLSRLPDRGRQQ